MRTRSGAMLTATALGAALATAAPSYAASATGHSQLSPPYDIAVTSTVDPNPSGATHSTVSVNRLVPGGSDPFPVAAGSLIARWGLYAMPDGQTNWRLCRQSDPNGHYTSSTVSESTFTLNNSAFMNPAQTACGDGLYDLVTDGYAWVNNGWHGYHGVISGPEHLAGSTPIPPGSPAAAAAAAAASGKAAAAAAAAGAAAGNPKAAVAAAAVAKASAAAGPPALPSVPLPPPPPGH